MATKVKGKYFLRNRKQYNHYLQSKKNSITTVFSHNYCNIWYLLSIIRINSFLKMQTLIKPTSTIKHNQYSAALHMISAFSLLLTIQYVFVFEHEITSWQYNFIWMTNNDSITARSCSIIHTRADIWNSYRHNYWRNISIPDFQEN